MQPIPSISHGRVVRLGPVAIGFLIAALMATAIPHVAAASSATPTGLSQLLAAKGPSAVTRGIVKLSEHPVGFPGCRPEGPRPHRAADAQGAPGPGRGHASAPMQRAVASGAALDVPGQRHPAPRHHVRRRDGCRRSRKGFTGQGGVTVAVVDSGCDASHPDLADHVVHNVILASAEYLNIRQNGDNTIVVPTETGPYQNTDLGGGHGTHVAGIIAADSTTPRTAAGWASPPDAKLVCFAIGRVLFTTAVVTAYDHMLGQPDLWGIDVVNNSWGNSYRQFDPNDPVAVITKAVAARRHGRVRIWQLVRTEMSLNPFSEAPWVISVGAGSIDHHLASFSSTGLIYDDIRGRLHRPRRSHRRTRATGSASTTRTWWRRAYRHLVLVRYTAGTVVPALRAGRQRDAPSGTSMASPPRRGAAVLLRANPSLTPTQVRLALQATATPIKAADGKALPFWQVGYGYVDSTKAVALVRGSNWRQLAKVPQQRLTAECWRPTDTGSPSPTWTGWWRPQRGRVAGDATALSN